MQINNRYGGGYARSKLHIHVRRPHSYISSRLTWTGSRKGMSGKFAKLSEGSAGDGGGAWGRYFFYIISDCPQKMLQTLTNWIFDIGWAAAIRFWTFSKENSFGDSSEGFAETYWTLRIDLSGQKAAANFSCCSSPGWDFFVCWGLWSIFCWITSEVQKYWNKSGNWVNTTYESYRTRRYAKLTAALSKLRPQLQDLELWCQDQTHASCERHLPNTGASFSDMMTSFNDRWSKHSLNSVLWKSTHYPTANICK